MILNVFKHHKHHLPHLHTSTCFETGSKSLSRTTAKKINSLCLDAFHTDGAVLQIQMGDGTINLQHLSQFLAECDCAMQGFDFTNYSYNNIYSPWTQVHRTSALSSPQSKFWNHEQHSEQSNFDACWKSMNFNALRSECLDLKEGVSIQPFCWCTTPNQNKCKIIEDHMMPKSRCQNCSQMLILSVM